MFDRVIKSVTRQVTTFRDILPHCCLPTSETRRLRETRNARIDERLRSFRSLSSPSPSPTIRTSSGGGGGRGRREDPRERGREDFSTFKLSILGASRLPSRGILEHRVHVIHVPRDVRDAVARVGARRSFSPCGCAFARDDESNHTRCVRGTKRQ